MIRLNPDDRQADFFLPPGSLFGPHDGVVSGEDWLFTESARNGVVWAKADGSLQRHPLTPTPAFVRGLCALENSFLVGFTRLRQHPTPSWIVEFDAGFKREISRMDVSDFYPASIGAAIHALALAPGS